MTAAVKAAPTLEDLLPGAVEVVEHNGLAAALAAAQGELSNVHQDGRGNYGKYMTLPALIDAVRPVLAKHGLSWSAMPSIGAEGRPTMRYQLLHISGEVLSGEMALMLSRPDAQSQGSALTYAKRQALASVLNIGADADDDGQNATDVEQASNGGGQVRQVQAAPAEPQKRLASAAQRGLINAKAGEKKMPAEALATAVLAATGNEPREFESEAQARSWLQRSLDRLPASAVNEVLSKIDAFEVAA